jgi:hypothetical protein
MTTPREARRDARYYGEGAGTRRKLISATVDAKSQRDPSYARAFHTELSRQDMADHAAKARHERKRKDTTEAFTKNTKALATGNYQGVQSGLLVVVLAGVVAHRTGLDKMAYEKSQQLYRRARIRYSAYKLKREHSK